MKALSTSESQRAQKLTEALLRLLCLLSISVVLLAVPAAAQAPSPAALKYRGYVNDFAGVVDSQWHDRLEHLSTVVDQKTKAQIAVVTIPTLEGEPIEDFANRLFETWGIGHKDTRGLLLLLVIKDRKSRLEVGYGLEPIIPDGYSGSVLREMRPALREQKYGEALYAGSMLLAERIAQEAGVKLDDPTLVRTHRRGTQGTNWPVMALIILAMLMGVPWWIAMLAANSGRYRRGGFGGFGGGFGGYDSGGGGGGGFGGFGGGMSGGGGASSGW